MYARLRTRAHKSAANLLHFFEIYKYFGKKMKNACDFKPFLAYSKDFLYLCTENPSIL